MASTMKSVKESTRSLLALLANSFFSVTANSFCNSDHMVGKLCQHILIINHYKKYEKSNPLS